MSDIKFTLPKVAAKKGFQTVGGKYTFEDGELTVNEEDARKIKRILCRYYQCTVSVVKTAADKQSEEKAQAGDSVLSKAATKGSKD